MKTFKRLYLYIKPYMGYMIGSLFFTILVVALPLCQPYLIQIFTDNSLNNIYHISVGERIGYMKWVIIGFFAIVILKGYFSFYQGYLMNYGGQMALRKMREEYFSRILKMPVSFFEKSRTGEITSRGVNDINLTVYAYTNVISLLQDTLTVLFCIVMMFVKDWSMTLINLLVSPLIAFSVARFGEYVHKATGKLQGKVADITSLIYENIFNIKVVKVFNNEEYESRRFEEKSRENFNSSMKLVQFSITQTPVIELLSGIGFAIVIILGTLRVIKGTMSLGSIMGYWTYLILMSNPITRATGLYTMFQTARAAADRVFEYMDYPLEETDEREKKEISNIKGKIEFKDVSFGYNKDNPVLSDINLIIQPGEKVAFVGLNGAGKSTLVSLIPHFYKPSKGIIKIDGVDINEIKIRDLRNNITLVPQEITLFSGTIKNNIRYGDLNASEEEIMNASKIAKAHDFIINLPEGYNTHIADRGTGLSGGQKQRVSIARALLRKSKILILDEYTSGIDTESENLISEALEELMKGRTSLIIAHRLSTIVKADKIVVLGDGRIIETGSHNELIASGGLYCRFYESQFRKFDESENLLNGSK